MSALTPIPVVHLQQTAAAAAVPSAPTDSRSRERSAASPLIAKSTIQKAERPSEFGSMGFDHKQRHATAAVQQFPSQSSSAAQTPARQHTPSPAASSSPTKRTSTYTTTTVFSKKSGFQPIHSQLPSPQPSPPHSQQRRNPPAAAALRVTVVSPSPAASIPVTPTLNLHQLMTNFANMDVSARREWAEANQKVFLEIVTTFPSQNKQDKAEWLSYLPIHQLKKWALVQTEEFLNIVDSVPNHPRARWDQTYGSTICNDFIRLGACQKPSVCKFAANFFAQMKYQVMRDPLYKTKACIRALKGCTDGCSNVHLGDLVRIVKIITAAEGKTFYQFTGFWDIQTEYGPLQMPRPASAPRPHESAAAAASHPLHTRSEGTTPVPSVSPRKPQLQKHPHLRSETASPASSSSSSSRAAGSSSHVMHQSLGALGMSTAYVSPSARTPTPSDGSVDASPSARAQQSSSPESATVMLPAGNDDDAEIRTLLALTTTPHDEIEALSVGAAPHPSSIPFILAIPDAIKAKAALAHSAGGTFSSSASASTTSGAV